MVATKAELRRKLFGYPIGNRALELVETVFEEVCCAGNDDEPDVSVLFKFGGELSQLIDVAKLIVLAMDQQQRFAARFEELEIILIERRADADQVLNAIVVDPNVQPDARAERKTAEYHTATADDAARGNPIPHGRRPVHRDLRHVCRCFVRRREN